MKISQMMGGKYLKKDDCIPDLLLTIRGFEEENVAPQDSGKDDMKWVMYFEETDKGLVMNSTNLQLAAIALNSQDTDDWIGQKIVAFNDPAVQYAGKITGGVRLRPPRKSVTGKPAAKVPAMATDPRPEPPEEDSDLPF
jgi:hypothetical protein